MNETSVESNLKNYIFACVIVLSTIYFVYGCYNIKNWFVDKLTIIKLFVIMCVLLVVFINYFYGVYAAYFAFPIAAFATQVILFLNEKWEAMNKRKNVYIKNINRNSD